jgi:hypothetical protein
VADLAQQARDDRHDQADADGVQQHGGQDQGEGELRAASLEQIWS